MIDGSTLTSTTTSLPVTSAKRRLDLGEARVGERLGDGDLRASPRPCGSATSALKPRMMSRTANRRRLRATSRRKFAAMPPMPAAFEHRVERLGLHVGGEHRAAHQALAGRRFRRATPRIWRGPRWTASMALDLERQLEQCGRIASRHSGNHRIFPCHDCARCSARLDPGAKRCRRGRRKPLELKEDLDQGKARGNAARQTAGVLTQRGVRCNTAERRAPVLTRFLPLHGSIGRAGQ